MTGEDDSEKESISLCFCLRCGCSCCSSAVSDATIDAEDDFPEAE